VDNLIKSSERVLVAENHTCDRLTVKSLVFVQDVSTKMFHHFGIDNLPWLLKFFDDLIGVDEDGATVNETVRNCALSAADATG
jgi:hypothetical protein